MHTYVVITGASRGLGLEWVRQWVAYTRLASDSFCRELKILAVSRQGSLELSRLSEENECLETLDIDLSGELGPKHLSSALAGAPVFALVNNAGVYLDQDGEFPNCSYPAIRESFNTNAVMPLRVCAELEPNLSLCTKSRTPLVIQISSLMGSITDNTSGSSYAYRMSKAALNMMNRSLSKDRPDWICTVFHPGWVRTEMGGESAPIEVTESVSGMMKKALALTDHDSGRFFDYEGDELPW